MHVAAGKKCQYIGNCSFAHSTEERDLWTFMKENNGKLVMRYLHIIYKFSFTINYICSMVKMK